MSDNPLGVIDDMSDRTKHVMIMVVVVCLAIVVADLWIGVGPHQEESTLASLDAEPCSVALLRSNGAVDQQ